MNNNIKDEKGDKKSFDSVILLCSLVIVLLLVLIVLPPLLRILDPKEVEVPNQPTDTDDPTSRTPKPSKTPEIVSVDTLGEKGSFKCDKEDESEGEKITYSYMFYYRDKVVYYINTQKTYHNDNQLKIDEYFNKCKEKYNSTINVEGLNYSCEYVSTNEFKETDSYDWDEIVEEDIFRNKLELEFSKGIEAIDVLNKHLAENFICVKN